MIGEYSIWTLDTFFDLGILQVNQNESIGLYVIITTLLPAR